MVIAVRTEEVDGDLVVVKEARTEGDVARLTREASMLTRGRHPGVVELVGIDERAIRLRHSGTALSRLGPFPLDQAAGVVSAVADVVDALHRQGVVHGDVDGQHVVVDQRGRPRLCGFGLAAEHTEAGAAADVAALGRLLASQIRLSEGVPWAAPPRGLRSRARRRAARRELEALATRASTSDPASRPTARQFAKAIHLAVPSLSLPAPGSTPAPPTSFAEIPADFDPTADLGWTADDLSFLAADTTYDADPDLEPVAAPSAAAGLRRASVALADAPPPPTDLPTVPLREPEPSPIGARRSRWLGRTAVLAVVLVGGVLAGVVVTRAIDPFGGQQPSVTTTTTTVADAEATDSPASSVAPAAPTPVTWPARCSLPDPTGPDVDGDGCPEPIQLDGRTATIGNVTVTLGTEGDLVALGDWDCDGVATPALLRPTTGEVFVFADWSFDETVEVTASEVVEDAAAIASSSGACPVPVVTTPSGPVRVTLPR